MKNAMAEGMDMKNDRSDCFLKNHGATFKPQLRQSGMKNSCFTINTRDLVVSSQS